MATSWLLSWRAVFEEAPLLAPCFDQSKAYDMQRLDLLEYLYQGSGLPAEVWKPMLDMAKAPRRIKVMQAVGPWWQPSSGMLPGCPGATFVQSFLLGQREFRTVMRSPGLEQLRQRVLAAYHLKPLTPGETETYIKHRLAKVGWTDNPQIENDIYLGVYQFTTGVPRRINTLMDRLMLNASLDEERVLTFAGLRAITSEISDEQQAELQDDSAADRATLSPVSVVATPVAQVPVRDEASLGEIRKLEAKLAVMQRAFDNLSGEANRTAQSPSPAEIEHAPRRRGFPWWPVVLAVCGGGILAATLLLVLR